MKKVLFILLAGMMMFSMTACSSGKDNKTPESISSSEQNQKDIVSGLTNTSSEEISKDQNKSADKGNIMIAYFSRTGENYNVGVIEKGNTHIMADMIAEHTGGRIFEINTVVPYPENYKECTAIARQEKNENARPELTASVENMEDYNVVFIGYPIWWGDMPMAVYTFLESYDFSGKTIIPFCTHEGSGLSSTDSRIAEICPNAHVLDGLSIRGSIVQNSPEKANETVIKWLKKLGYAD